jgi:hypothetical protein
MTVEILGLPLTWVLQWHRAGIGRMGFLTSEDFDYLSEDDIEAFMKLEAISRGRLNPDNIDATGLEYDPIVRYMNEISALAKEFGLDPLDFDYPPENGQLEYVRFTLAVDHRRARYFVQRSRRNNNGSAAITGAARKKIQHYIEKLRDEISAAPITEKRKKALLDKITELEGELSKRRVSLAAMMTVAALVSTIVHENVETLKEAPGLIQSISALFGSAKEDEIELQRLSKPEPQKAIPDMRNGLKNNSLTTEFQFKDSVV